MRTISMDRRWSACLFIVKPCSLLARVYRCVVGKPFLALRLRVGAATRHAGTKQRASAEEIGSVFFIRTVCSSLGNAEQIYMVGASMSIATFQPVREQP